MADTKNKMFRGLGKDPYGAAVAYMKDDLHTVTTNERINRKEGKVAQADSEKVDRISINAAIRKLLGRK